MKTPFLSRPLTAALGLAGLLLIVPQAHADERESLEQLRQTTLGLIDALVEQGVITRERADALVRQAQARAAASASASTGGAREATAASPSTVRVQYVPQVVRDQIREEIREEVIAQARTERWGVPNALPEWTERIKIDGDVRLRAQIDRPLNDNAPAANYVAGAVGTGMTRIADLTRVNGAGEAIGNTEDSASNLRVRARLGVSARLSEQVSAGLRLSTGSLTNRVSTNQTLGQNFNKYQLLVDRAFVRYDPLPWLSVSGGRMPNPWFGTDMVWSENLNFEGLAVSTRWAGENTTVAPFATVGAFPVRADEPTQQDARWLYGAQGGLDWEATPRTRLKFGVALYSYRDIEGRPDNRWDIVNSVPLLGYGGYEYPSSLRQKGNTLFLTNDPADSGTAYWGLMSKFRPLVLSAAADFSHFNPVHVMVSAEYAQNLAFDRDEMLRRTGIALLDGSDKGYQLRVAVGDPDVRLSGDWQASFTYRYLGSDAVLDAFNDSDLGGGGTNLKGYTLGLSYGVDRNASLGVRWLSADSIDAPTMLAGDKYSLDTLQVDFNVRF